jgi:hypothetical protein
MSIRKAYLSTAPPPPRSRQRDDSRSNGAGSGSRSVSWQREDDDGLRKWEGSKYLTDRERDEIDLRGKMILRRCRERVGVLEDEEKGGCLVLSFTGSHFAALSFSSFLSSLITDNDHVHIHNVRQVGNR